MGSCLCDQCAALCCRYFALPIENPTTANDYDDIRWYLVHENVVIFIEKRQWYLGVMSKCKHLGDDNRCGIYETRPRICKEYSTENCDWHGGEYEFDTLFTSAEQLREYGEMKLAKLAKRDAAKGAKAGKGKLGGKAKPAGSRRRPLVLKPVGAALATPKNGNGRLVALGLPRPR